MAFPIGGKENLPPQRLSGDTSDTEATSKNAAIVDQLIHLDYQCDFEVTVARPIGDLANLFQEPPTSLDFDQVSDMQTGAKLETIEVKPSRFEQGTQAAECRFSTDPRTNAVYQMDYNAERKEVVLQETYNGLLPRWVRTGDHGKWLHPEKGVPTAKVMQLLLFKQLGLSKENTSVASSCAMNSQTVVDVMYAMIIEGKSVEQAFAESQSVQMLTEVGQMLGYNHTKLTAVTADTPGAYTHIPTALTYTGWSQEQISDFAKQPKVVALEKAGVPIMDPDFKVPDALNVEVRFTD